MRSNLNWELNGAGAFRGWAKSLIKREVQVRVDLDSWHISRRLKTRTPLEEIAELQPCTGEQPLGGTSLFMPKILSRKSLRLITGLSINGRSAGNSEWA